MSELLRAVLDASCVDSQIAFYNAQVDTVSVNTGAITFAEKDVYFNCKSDTWFLLIGLTQHVSRVSASGNFFYPSDAQVTSLQIANAQDQQAKSQGFTLKSNLNFTLNNFQMLGEYMLFKPNDTIIIRQQCPVTDAGVFTWTTNCTMTGIEYKFPADAGKV